MACFIAPAAAAIAVSGLKNKLSPDLHLDWLAAMLWGGAIMLTVDHALSGELIPYPPFITSGIFQAGPEIIRVGGLMLAATIAVWLALVALNRLKSSAKEPLFARK